MKLLMPLSDTKFSEEFGIDWVPLYNRRKRWRLKGDVMAVQGTHRDMEWLQQIHSGTENRTARCHRAPLHVSGEGFESGAGKRWCRSTRGATRSQYWP